MATVANIGLGGGSSREALCNSTISDDFQMFVLVPVVLKHVLEYIICLNWSLTGDYYTLLVAHQQMATHGLVNVSVVHSGGLWRLSVSDFHFQNPI